MGASGRQNLDHLIDELSQNASLYSMFYAIHKYETLLKRAEPGRLRSKLHQNGLRFRPFEQYTFQSRNLHHVEYDGDAMTFVLSFLGLYGNDSPLPRSYHDQISLLQKPQGKGKIPLQDFLDIFNNRYYWLYYKAWKKYRYYLQRDGEEEGTIREHLYAFTGLGGTTQNQKLPVSPHTLLGLSGILGKRVRNKQGLLVLLEAFFPAVKIRIREFVRSMVRIENRPAMGRIEGKKRALLGKNCIVGQWVADYSSRICIVVGPISFDQFLEFLPDGRYAHTLRSALNLYLNDSLRFDVKLIVDSDGIRTISWQDKRMRLGRSLWLGKPKKDKVERYIPYEEYIAH